MFVPRKVQISKLPLLSLPPGYCTAGGKTVAILWGLMLEFGLSVGRFVIHCTATG